MCGLRRWNANVSTATVCDGPFLTRDRLDSFAFTDLEVCVVETFIHPDGIGRSLGKGQVVESRNMVSKTLWAIVLRGWESGSHSENREKDERWGEHCESMLLIVSLNSTVSLSKDEAALLSHDSLS